MSYIEDVCQPLIQTLRHFARLPTFQVAGHAANAAFWMSETKHRFDLIDGYHSRFKTLQNAQKEYVSLHDVHQKGFPWQEESQGIPPLKRSTKDNTLKELRRELAAAAFLFLRRCHSDGFLNAALVDRFESQLNIDLSELHK